MLRETMAKVFSPGRAEALGLLALAALFAGAWWVTAWVCDDAFITLRTVDNALHGHGLTWNVDERVQTYTHPLWLLALLLVGAPLGDLYATSLLLGALGTAATLWILVRRVAVSRASAALVLAALFGSRAFVDYASSGMENPLAHALLAALFVACARQGASETLQLVRAGLAALLLLTRLDLAFAAAPLLAGAWWRDGLPRPRTLVLGALPLVAWELFSLVYYGAWLANSARAKLSAGLPPAERIAQGAYYLWATVRWDPISAVLLVMGPVMAWRVRDPFRLPVGVALVAQTAWVVWVGGDFMAGRFLTVPLLLAALLLARVPLTVGVGWGAALAVVVTVMAVPYLSPFASRDYGSDWHAAIDAHGVADERRFHLDSTALQSVLVDGGWRAPQEREQVQAARKHYAADPWLAALTAVGVLDERGDWPPPAGAPGAAWPPVFVKGGVGLFGLRMGPQAVLVDYHALGDPLLARLPALPRDPVLALLIPRLADLDWRAGHHVRPVPSGYVLSRATGENRIRDPDLHELYETIREVVAGPLWTAQRWRAIARLHSSWADERVEQYVGRSAAYRGEPRAGISDPPSAP